MKIGSKVPIRDCADCGLDPFCGTEGYHRIYTQERFKNIEESEYIKIAQNTEVKAISARCSENCLNGCIGCREWPAIFNNRCDHIANIVEKNIKTGETRMKKTYKPKIVKGIAHNTGYPIDGKTLIFGLWDHDPESYSLVSWDENDKEIDKAVMQTLYQAESEAGMCLCDTLEEFKEVWDFGDYEPEGSFCIDLDKVKVIEVIQEEENAEKD